MSALGEIRRVVYAMGRGLQRLASGSAFPEAIRSPQDPGVFGRGSQPDFSLEHGWDRRYCVDRAQQLHRANLLAGSIIDRSVEHVIGPGYRLQVLSGDKGFNRDLRLMWEEWCNTPALCDVRARSTYRQLKSQAFVGKMRDGDSLYYMRTDGRIRVVNSIEIASPTGGYWRTTESDGVEKDLDGKHLFYWIHEPDEVPYSNIRSAIHRLMKVPAKDCVFMARTPLGAPQTRGITAFLGTFVILEQVDGTIMALGKKAQTAAKLSMVITKKSPIPTASFGGDPRKNPLTRLEDNTLTRLEPDEDIKPVQSADPNANMIELLETMIRIVGTRWGLSLATVLLKHDDHNFSNARASSIETHGCTLANQLEVAQSDSEVFAMKTMQFIREGKIRAKRSTLEKALRHKWRFPARPLVDPLAERQADLLALDMGTTTYEEIAARDGLTAGERFRKLSHERELKKKYDLPDVRSSLTREEVEMAPPEDNGRPPKKKKSAAD